MSPLQDLLRAHPSITRTDGCCERPLLDFLIAFVTEIVASGHDLDSACWVDDDYEYIELTLPEGTDLELDLNVHGPRVLIRAIRGDR